MKVDEGVTIPPVQQDTVFQEVPMAERDRELDDGYHEWPDFRTTSPYASFGQTLIRPSSFADDFENGILPDTPDPAYHR